MSTFEEEEQEWYLVSKMRAIVEARDPLQAKEVDDFTLRRFLRARDLDIAKGSSLFLKFLKWRRKTVPKGFISESEIQNELSQRKIFLQGLDKVGRPILISFSAKHDKAKRQMDEFKRFVVYFFDKACARTPSEKFLLILDYEGFGLRRCDTRAYIASLKILQNYYPERMGKVLVINAPPLFMRAWKIISRFIDKNTRGKITFVRENLQEALLTEIDKSQLPDVYGGEQPLVPIEYA